MPTGDRFYNDALAIVSAWEGLLLRLELLLIWKQPVFSFIFALLVHATFWCTCVFRLNKIFIATLLLCLLVVFDLGRNRFWPLLEDLLFKVSGVNLATETQLAVAKGEIWSVQQLASRCAWMFHVCVSALNTVVPKRSSHPIVFLLASCSLGMLFIWLGSKIDENNLLYLLLNIVLVYPGLHHYAVLSTIWQYMKPVIDMIDAEFDRGQIETPSQRDREEREFWEPIVNSPDFNDDAKKAFPSGNESWNPSPSHKQHPDDWSDSSLEADTSEAQFLQSLLPKRMQASKRKNRLAVNAITKELLSDNPSQADIDDWFSEVTDDPTPSRLPPRSPRRRRDDSSDFDGDLDPNDSPLSSPPQTDDFSGPEEDSGYVMVS
nr:unnamed protein product [Spirometra erinaceieuropaei]